MFNFKRSKHEDSDLEVVITDLISEMAGHDGNSEEYTQMCANLKTLAETRAIEDDIEKPNRPSADTIALVAGNLLGIAAILTFEKVNVITSKSLGFVMKPKI